MCDIVLVKQEEVMDLSFLASAIVKEHFDPLIGADQNDYMLSLFQTPEAIQKQMEDGYRYYWVNDKNKHVGFLAFYPRVNKMYLSKFYIQKESRGKHLARKMLEFVEAEARKEHLVSIYLNVNKDNVETIAIYKHLGFTIIRNEKNDIGNGYFMDDFVMEYSLPFKI